MKVVRRIIRGISLAILGLSFMVNIVLAVPSSVTDFIGIATDTTITLRWDLASSSNSTVIRYSTTTYPATVASGTSAYNGTASYTTLTGLTAGTTYYFSAWGYDGSDYSSTATTLVVTTLSTKSDNTTLPFNKPSVPTSVTQDPDTSGWSISPIDDILSYFADPTNAHSGLGMPVNNVVMFISGLGVTIVSVSTYVKWRSFGSAWFIALILCCGLCSVEVMQWIVVIYLLIIGGGVAALNKALE